MADLLCLLDTNILLRWIKPDDRDYSLVTSAVERLLRERTALCYTSQNVAEFWNTCTRPLGQNGYGLSPEQTDHRVKLFEENLRLLPDTVAVHEEWRKLIVAHSVRGVQVHDARLAAAMRVHGVQRILTFNEADFARYPGIEAIHPRTISASSR
jgi:predicted nucleic acid-binding protein